MAEGFGMRPEHFTYYPYPRLEGVRIFWRPFLRRAVKRLYHLSLGVPPAEGSSIIQRFGFSSMYPLFVARIRPHVECTDAEFFARDGPYMRALGLFFLRFGAVVALDAVLKAASKETAGKKPDEILEMRGALCARATGTCLAAFEEQLDVNESCQLLPGVAMSRFLAILARAVPRVLDERIFHGATAAVEKKKKFRENKVAFAASAVATVAGAAIFFPFTGAIAAAGGCVAVAGGLYSAFTGFQLMNYKEAQILIHQELTAALKQTQYARPPGSAGLLKSGAAKVLGALERCLAEAQEEGGFGMEGVPTVSKVCASGLQALVLGAESTTEMPFAAIPAAPTPDARAFPAFERKGAAGRCRMCGEARRVFAELNDVLLVTVTGPAPAAGAALRALLGGAPEGCEAPGDWPFERRAPAHSGPLLYGPVRFADLYKAHGLDAPAEGYRDPAVFFAQPVVPEDTWCGAGAPPCRPRSRRACRPSSCASSPRSRGRWAEEATPTPSPRCGGASSRRSWSCCGPARASRPRRPRRWPPRELKTLPSRSFTSRKEPTQRRCARPWSS
eukprot:gnl/Chilomastix_cuspidata/1612.p1 GENE.gnl/Chilomastix_cuspidata/1612~~gnl/Chilomastix_cuspidata/1612.p1  ORF type:complete len:560 (-),score=194.43 gnl/Chilomastix_cuspidata/1612:306-1985(-)